jgi:hypothetical protein
MALSHDGSVRLIPASLASDELNRLNEITMNIATKPSAHAGGQIGFNTAPGSADAKFGLDKAALT